MMIKSRFTSWLLSIISTMQMFFPTKSIALDKEFDPNHSIFEKELNKDVSEIKYAQEYSGFSKAEQDDIIKLHNDYRGNVDPPAAKMFELKWDNDLAELAKNWTDKCIFHHGPDACMKGGATTQNLFQGPNDYKRAVKEWHDEIMDYNYNTHDCKTVCGHYTQVVWADTYSVGCSTSDCGKFHIIACNYFPLANYPGVRPYEEGTSCSKCFKCTSHTLCALPNRTVPVDLIRTCSDSRGSNVRISILTIIFYVTKFIFSLSL